MPTPRRKWVSEEEYLALEEATECRNEYCNGEVFPLLGSPPEHSLITVNVAVVLGNQLAGRSNRVFCCNQRVKGSKGRFYAYPDAVVTCATPVFDGNSLCNPLLVVEVLSEATEWYDRGEKFAHYARLASLQEYVLVSTHRHRIERLTRREGGNDWTLADCTDPEGSLILPSLGGALSLARIYHKADLPDCPPLRR